MFHIPVTGRQITLKSSEERLSLTRAENILMKTPELRVCRLWWPWRQRKLSTIVGRPLWLLVRTILITIRLELFALSIVMKVHSRLLKWMQQDFHLPLQRSPSSPSAGTLPIFQDHCRHAFTSILSLRNWFSGDISMGKIAEIRT